MQEVTLDGAQSPPTDQLWSVPMTVNAGNQAHIHASATPGEFAWGTPFGGQWPRNRHRSLGSVRIFNRPRIAHVVADTLTAIRGVGMD